jgi:hypothetical protein
MFRGVQIEKDYVDRACNAHAGDVSGVGDIVGLLVGGRIILKLILIQDRMRM